MTANTRTSQRPHFTLALLALSAGLALACDLLPTNTGEEDPLPDEWPNLWQDEWQDDEPLEPGAWPPPVRCGEVLPGPPVDEEETEAFSGYADILATTDLASLPTDIDFSGNNILQRIVINYMLGQVGRSQVARTEAEASGPLGKAVLVAAAHGEPGRLDFATLRLGLAYFYPCSRPIPGSLSELESRYGDYATWSQFVVECSSAKGTRRRISQSFEQGVSIAETLGEDGSVRETEAIFSKLRDDGHLDFAVYTADGVLSDRSTFNRPEPDGFVGSSPYMCISCHMNPATGTVSTSFPAGVAATCD